MGKVRIIHISDLHLFVDADGNHRPLDERAKLARFADHFLSALDHLPSETIRGKAAALIGGFGTHSDSALRAMLATIDLLLSDRSQPSIVVQTGDISTFGGFTCSDEHIQFPEWEYWQGPAHNERRARAAAWLDLFGNHDVWPGSLPLVRAARIERVVQAFRDRHFPQRMPTKRTVELDGFVLELHTLNSVLSGPIDNTFAVGELRPDVTGSYPESPPDPLSDVLANCGTHERVLRALLMHHPPHHFEKPGGSEGGLRDKDRLAAWLSERDAGGRFHLVLAGHRHAIDPPLGAQLPHPQPPLPDHALQFVCSTPTQDGATKPSFSTYEVDYEREQATLTRSIYAPKRAVDRRFSRTDAGTFKLALG